MPDFTTFPTRSISLIAAVCFALSATAMSAHEFWLDAAEYQVPIDGEISVALTNGQEFQGVSLSYFPRRVVLFDQVIQGTRDQVTARAGDAPVKLTAPDEAGLLTLLYQSNDSTVTYEGWDKFQTFVDHKAFGDVRSRHSARGLSEERFKEVYSRYAKSLLAVGHGKGQDSAQGLEIEIVALANPFTDDLSAGLPVQVVYQGNKRSNAQVEIFEKAPDGSVTISTELTDDAGIAVIPVKPGFEYLLDSVVLREPSAKDTETFDAAWETLWASLTFAIPQ